VRSALIIFLFPSIGNLLNLAHIYKQLYVQALITELAYEALDVCVLPWASRFNVNGFASFFLQPLAYSCFSGIFVSYLMSDAEPQQRYYIQLARKLQKYSRHALKEDLTEHCPITLWRSTLFTPLLENHCSVRLPPLRLS
jgi:hypothetical protein